MQIVKIPCLRVMAFFVLFVLMERRYWIVSSGAGELLMLEKTSRWSLVRRCVHWLATIAFYGYIRLFFLMATKSQKIVNLVVPWVLTTLLDTIIPLQLLVRPSLVYWLFPITACINFKGPHRNWLFNQKLPALPILCRNVILRLMVIVKCTQTSWYSNI